jgi:hypothetical protein
VILRNLFALALLLAGSVCAGAQSRARVVPAPTPSAGAQTKKRAVQKPRAGAQGKTKVTPKAKAKAKVTPKAPASRQKRRVAPPPRVVRTPVPADTNAAASAAGKGLAVTLITFGVGQEVWERFGHNALWIHDESAGTDIAYNWGLFDFEQPDFVKRFLTGDTHYWMAGEEALRMVSNYRSIGRAATLQRLNLTPAQAARLRDFVQNNAREENKYYRYDYFRDNCSTRLRDALDLALGGALRAATDTMRTPLTYRSESVRLTDGDLPIETGIDLALGRPADVPLTAWESFFVPMRMRDGLRRVTVPGPNGAMVPLVTDEQVIPPTPGTVEFKEAPVSPDLTPRCLITGVLLALLVFVLRIMMYSRRAAAWGLALFAAAWSLLSGALGVILLLAWFTTRHVFWAYNENVLIVSPLSLLLVVLAPAALLSARGVGKARVIAWLVAGQGLVAVVLALQPGGQDNQALVALFFPVHLALAWALSKPLPVREKTTPTE